MTNKLPLLLLLDVSGIPHYTSQWYSYFYNRNKFLTIGDFIECVQSQGVICEVIINLFSSISHKQLHWQNQAHSYPPNHGPFHLQLVIAHTGVNIRQDHSQCVIIFVYYINVPGYREVIQQASFLFPQFSMTN